MADTGGDETWQYNKSFLEKNKYMLDNQLATDVAFLVGENPAERLRAHQYVMITGSPVFYAMLCGPMRETGEIRVPDITPQAFMQMLRFLYYEEAEITGDLVMQVLYCAKKYLIPALAARCTKFLKKNLNVENIGIVLEQCIPFNEKKVISKCMEVVEQHTLIKVLKSQTFAEVSHTTLSKVLEIDTSSVREVKLFQASIDWAKAKLSKISPSGDEIRNTLGEALYKLRFPTMNIREFANVVVPTNILNNAEQLLCFQYISQDNKPDTMNMPFPTMPRVDNCCDFIHLKRRTLWNGMDSQPRFIIRNHSVGPLVVIGFQVHEVPLRLFIQKGTYGIDPLNEVYFQAHVTGTCTHNDGKCCITFPAIRIYQRGNYRFGMDFRNNGNIFDGKCIEFHSGSTTNKRAEVHGHIPITEILVHKDY